MYFFFFFNNPRGFCDFVVKDKLPDISTRNSYSQHDFHVAFSFYGSTDTVDARINGFPINSTCVLITNLISNKFYIHVENVRLFENV